MGYQQNRSSSISTFHDYNQQNNEYDDGDSGWKGFGGNDDKSNSREEGVRARKVSIGAFLWAQCIEYVMLSKFNNNTRWPIYFGKEMC